MATRKPRAGDVWLTYDTDPDWPEFSLYVINSVVCKSDVFPGGYDVTGETQTFDGKTQVGDWEWLPTDIFIGRMD